MAIWNDCVQGLRATGEHVNALATAEGIHTIPEVHRKSPTTDRPRVMPPIWPAPPPRVRVIITFTIVANLKHIKERVHVPAP
jgi:hypothetical protein